MNFGNNTSLKSLLLITNCFPFEVGLSDLSVIILSTNIQKNEKIGKDISNKSREGQMQSISAFG